jgi:hypothetical protein
VVTCSSTTFSRGDRHQRRQDAVDEHRFAVEDVDIGIGDFAVDEQRHSDRLHPLQRG